ncbi:hypothetical protein Tco_0286021 [Tanacetum coccineum]
MDNPNITMEEYIRLEEEKARKRRKVFNWEIAKYGKIWYNEDVYDLRSVETEFPAIIFNDNLTSNETPYCESTVSSLYDEIDFIISFDESDDEDYMVVFDKNSFSYKIISTNDLKTNSEKYNEKVNKPLFPSPEPSVSYEFDLKDETSLAEYDKEEQNVLYFNDLFPFNIIYPNDLKSDKDNDDNKIDMIQSSGGNENTQGSNELLKASHDKISKVFIIRSFVTELNINIMAWNYLVNGMLVNLIKSLYMPFGIPFDPKQYYKDGDCARMLQRPRVIRHMALLQPREQRHPFLRMRMEHHDGDGVVVFTSEAWGSVFDTRGPLVRELILVFLSTLRFREVLLYLDAPGTIQFQLRGARRRLSWREFILALGLYTGEEIESFDFSRDISTDGDFLGPPPSYTLIRDLVLRLCHRMITHSIAGRSQAPEKVTVTDLFYLRGLDVGSFNIPYLLAQYLKRFGAGRKSGALILGGQFMARLAEHFGLLTEERLQGLTITATALPIIDMTELVRMQICAEFRDTWAWVPAGLARQEGDARGVTEEALVAPRGGDEDEEMPQTVPSPPRTQGKRISRLEEEVHGMREDLAESKEINEVGEVSIFWNLMCDCSHACIQTHLQHTSLLINSTWRIYRAKYQGSFSF